MKGPFSNQTLQRTCMLNQWRVPTSFAFRNPSGGLHFFKRMDFYLRYYYGFIETIILAALVKAISFSKEIAARLENSIAASGRLRAAFPTAISADFGLAACYHLRPPPQAVTFCQFHTNCSMLCYTRSRKFQLWLTTFGHQYQKSGGL